LNRLKLHYAYLLNRVSRWFIVVLLALLTVGIIEASGLLEIRGSLDVERELRLWFYRKETLNLTKMAGILIAIFLGIQGFYSQFNRYHVFFLSGNKGKNTLIWSKLLALITLELGIIIHAIIIIHGVGWYLTPFFRYDKDFMIALMLVAVQIVIYGLLEALLMQCFDSIFTGILPLALYWMMEVNLDYQLIHEKPWLKILHMGIPVPLYENGQWIVFFAHSQYVLWIIVLIIINMVVFCIKDLKT